MILFLASVGRAEQNTAARLQEADRLAWLTDWYGALPIYTAAEKAAATAGNRRDAMYAKFGRLRGQMQTRSLGALSEDIATDLETPIATGDLKLRLRGLTVKGDIDLEWDVEAAQQDWEQVREVARKLGDKGWENRATGELALVAFLKGNTGEATTLVQTALQAATQSGDVGGQLRYMGAIANGLLLAGYPPMAMGYVDRALALAAAHPETGFPFVVYSTKVLSLLALNQTDEAERVAKTAMAEAHKGDRRIKEAELLMMLAQIAQRRGQPDAAVGYLEQAITRARAGQVQRVLGEAEASVAELYRSRGALSLARRHATAAVEATATAGARFTLPVRIGVLADIYSAQGRLAEADRLYEQATDIVEGIMVNVPSRDAQARLVGVMSNLYTGHFQLAADRLHAPIKAFQIIERARGRAVADVLRTLPNSRSVSSEATNDQLRAISRLQARLMTAATPADRKQVLDELWDTEQRTTPQPPDRGGRLLTAKTRVTSRAIQQNLGAGEIVLEYVLAESRSYCVVISRETLTLVQLPAKQRIEQLVDRFTTDLRGGRAATSQAATELYDAVVQPIAQWRTAKRVFVVPDGKLHLLPFDALLNTQTAPSPIVTMVPSANVLFLLRTRPRLIVPERQLLAMGGVPYDRMFASGPIAARVNRSDDSRGLFDADFPSKLANLPSAQAEVVAAARLVGPGNVVLTGDQATESALKTQNLGNFNILHFAVHAFTDPKFPERAALVLLNDAAAGDDGLLQPREIAQFRLNASVVVLSACDTAVGPTLGQEGVLNIARAFLLAGAQSVVTTLWAVSDSVSMALMRRFYENLSAGQDVAEALTRSKRAVIEQFGPDALPTVAAFQVVGAGDQRTTIKSAAVKGTTGQTAR